MYGSLERRIGGFENRTSTRKRFGNELCEAISAAASCEIDERSSLPWLRLHRKGRPSDSLWTCPAVENTTSCEEWSPGQK
jgi:hypothetical protein